MGGFGNWALRISPPARHERRMRLGQLSGEEANGFAHAWMYVRHRRGQEVWRNGSETMQMAGCA